MQDVQLPPLNHPRSQIRLLKATGPISYPRNARKCRLQYEIHVHDLLNAPTYLALSYMWGSADESTSIRINGRDVRVRPNCRHALWQAQLHYPGRWIWIDAICIDQGNLAEKTAQVLMMGRIYSEAEVVLIALGDHDKWIKYLFQGWKQIEKDWKVSTLPTDRTGPHGVSLGAGIYALLQRPYFERLWIYQEIALAKRRVILCGNDRVSGDLLTFILSRRLVTNTVSLRLEYVMGSEKPTLDRVTRQFSDAKCADPRDRIYGLLHLIDWKGHQGTLPGYEKSAVELAIAAVKLLIYDKHDLARLEDLFGALEIDRNDPLLCELLQRRQSSLVSAKPPPPSEHHRMKFTWDARSVLRIEQDYWGALICRGLKPRQNVRSVSESEKDLRRLLAATPDRYRQIFACCDQIAGLVCPNARPGDYLLPQSWIDLCLVLRRLRYGKLIVVGQGVIFETHTTVTNKRRPYFNIALTASDLLAFVAQDRKNPNLRRTVLDRYCAEARLARLQTALTGPSEGDRITASGPIFENIPYGRFSERTQGMSEEEAYQDEIDNWHVWNDDSACDQDDSVFRQEPFEVFWEQAGPSGRCLLRGHRGEHGWPRGFRENVSAMRRCCDRCSVCNETIAASECLTEADREALRGTVNERRQVSLLEGLD